MGEDTLEVMMAKVIEPHDAVRALITFAANQPSRDAMLGRWICSSNGRKIFGANRTLDGYQDWTAWLQDQLSTPPSTPTPNTCPDAPMRPSYRSLGDQIVVVTEVAFIQNIVIFQDCFLSGVAIEIA